MMNPSQTNQPNTAQARIGRGLQNYLSVLRKTFPPTNPYGQALEDFFLSGLEDMSGQMAMGNPRAVVGVPPRTGLGVTLNLAGVPLINTSLFDLADVTPLGTATKAATGVANLVAPALAGLGVYGVNRQLKNLLDIDDSTTAENVVEAMDQGILGARLATDPETNVMITTPAKTVGAKFDPPDRLGFRSTVKDVLKADNFPNSGTPEQIEAAFGQKGGLPQATLNQIGNRQVDEEELKFLGITDLIEDAKANNRKVTKEDINNAIARNEHQYNFREEILDFDPGDAFEANVSEPRILDYEESFGRDNLDADIEYEVKENFSEELSDLEEKFDLEEIDTSEYDDGVARLYARAEDAILEAYNEDPVTITRLLDNDGEDLPLYIIGSEGTGYSIRRGGDLVEESETIGDVYSTFNEAELQLRNLGFEDYEMYDELGGQRYRDYIIEEDIGAGEDQLDNYREIVVRLPYEAGGNIGNHYGDDVAYHYRVSDRDLDGENVLFVHEIQSDYAQTGAGRKPRLKVFPEDEATEGGYKQILNLLNTDYGITKGQLKLGLSRFNSEEANAARSQIIDKLFDVEKDIGDKMLGEYFDDIPDNLVSAFNVQPKERAIQSSTLAMQADLRAVQKDSIEAQPLVAGKEKWTQHAVKNLITKMVREDYPKIVFTSGKNQADYWRTPGLAQYYDVNLPNQVKKILKGIDKEAVEIKTLGDEDAKHIIINNTQKIKDFIEGKLDVPQGFGISAVAPVVGSGLLSMPQENQTEQNITGGLLT